MTSTNKQFDLDMHLFEFPVYGKYNAFTIRHAAEGILVTGGIGSGKSSGSGRMIALKYLHNNFGGLVLCTKPDEKEMWVEYCRLTGRSDDLLILEPGGKHSFSFLEYESSASVGLTSTDTLVQVLKTVIRAGQELDGGRSDDSFWETALDMLIANSIDLCRLAYNEVTVQRLYDIVQSTPQAPSDVMDRTDRGEPEAFDLAFRAAHQAVLAQIEVWSAKLSADEQAALSSNAAYDARLQNDLPDARLLKLVDTFFNKTLVNLSDKTRSVLDFSFSGFLFSLLREPIYSLFCKNSCTLTPEDSLNGRIILLNLPVKQYEKAGRDAQILFKYCWQRAMEKRDINRNDRPVFLFADECQFFLHEHDQATQTTARSSRICTVYLTQNLHNLHAAMGGIHSEHKVKSFLGTLASKFFHAQSDPETNDFASKLIGDSFFFDESSSTTVAQNFAETSSKSLKLERTVRPEEFQRLRTGGPLNQHRVDAYLYRQTGFTDGRNHVKINFDQQYTPRSVTAS